MRRHIYIMQPCAEKPRSVAGKLKMVHPVAEANENSPFGNLSPTEFYSRHSVSHSSEFITNSRGLKLFTQSWTPVPPAPGVTATVCVVHGFAGESSWLLQLTAVHIAKAGFAVCAVDHQGHGFSDAVDGLPVHIPDVEPVVDDCAAFFDSFRARFDSSLPSFIYAESLGGAISLLITLRRGKSRRPFDGVVLSGAMCGISAKFKPPWPLEHLLWLVATLVPTWRVARTRGSIADVSYKVEWKRKLAGANPRKYKGKARAATAQELMRVCREVQSRFEEVDVPLLIVHGGDDVVCDPDFVEELYRRAASKDKTLKIYPGMWHQLIGEPDESVDLVFDDIINWLKTRAQGAKM